MDRKEFNTGKRASAGGPKKFGENRSRNKAYSGKRFESDNEKRTYGGGAGRGPGTGRRGKSPDEDASGRRDERPWKKKTMKTDFTGKESRFAGDRRIGETDRGPAPGFKAKRKEFTRGKPNIARPVDRSASPDAEEREDRIEGRNPVLEALRSERPLNKIFIEKGNPDATLSKIAAMAREKAVPVQYVDRKKLDLMSVTRVHQGVILEAAAHEYAEVSDILRIAAEKGEDPFIVVLDGITDTNNFGSIIRSAECAGVHGIIIPKRRSATLNATVAKVAAGAQEFVAIARVTNLTQTIRELKDKGIWITAADLEGDRPYYESDLNGPVALVIGSEGEGISRVVKEECDYLVKIPMKGKISSLNAGVAAGLIMFEIAKRRG